MAIWGEWWSLSPPASLCLSPEGGFHCGCWGSGLGAAAWVGWGGGGDRGAARENNERGDGESWDFSPARAFAVRHDGSSRPARRRPQHFFPQTLEPISLSWQVRGWKMGIFTLYCSLGFPA